MHALPAYLNGASNRPRGRARQDEELEVLNVLMRSTGFVRDARGSFVQSSRSVGSEAVPTQRPISPRSVSD